MQGGGQIISLYQMLIGLQHLELWVPRQTGNLKVYENCTAMTIYNLLNNIINKTFI